MKIFKVIFHVPTFFGRSDADACREAVRQQLVNLTNTLPTAGKSMTATYGGAECILSDDDTLTALQAIGVGEYGDELRISKIELVMNTADPLQVLRPMLERMELAAARLSEPAFNDRAQTPIPGPHLIGISRLMLAENCCTDELQSFLDEGWRLIAVCPQEARRPDYILGRHGDPGQTYGTAQRP